MEIKKLSSKNLTEKEAKIYFAALQIGLASITTLAKKARVKRPTAYLALELLLSKNLLIPRRKGKNMHYKAADPLVLLKEAEQRKNTIASLLPELQKLYLKTTAEEKSKGLSSKKDSAQAEPQGKKKSGLQSIFSVDALIKTFTKKI